MEVLKDEKFLLLSPKMVQFIVRRDTLCIHSEMTVIFALNRWSSYQCSERKLPPSTSNKVSTSTEGVRERESNTSMIRSRC